jgi:hypothetical protein
MRVDLNDCSDAELIRAAGADAATFGVLYERHALRVYNVESPPARLDRERPDRGYVRAGAAGTAPLS